MKARNNTRNLVVISAALLSAALLSAVACSPHNGSGTGTGTGTGGGAAAATLAISVAPTFSVDKYTSPILLVGVTGRNLDPLSTDPVTIQVTNALHQPVDVLFTNGIDVGSVAFGRGVVGIDLGAGPLPDGTYTICATTSKVLPPAPCQDTTITKAVPTACEKAFEAAKGKIGCRCASGEIRSDQAPDLSLGQFVPGGNKGGPYNNNMPNLDSVFKFEAHFTVAILNDPGTPAGCTAAEWQKLTIGLCTEGQEINWTRTTKSGTTPAPDNTPGTGKTFPYDPDAGAAFTQDGWGYTHPSPGSGDPDRVLGAIKAYDAPNIIHWLDVPGQLGTPPASVADELPWVEENEFHDYVKGTTGMPADDCHCYFHVRDVVFNKDGTSGPSVLDNVKCTP